MNKGGTSSKRASLSVPGTSKSTDNETPTIRQLLAETNMNQPVILSSSYLTVDSNAIPSANQPQQQHRGRS
jgi:hypothetical protein